MACAFRSVARVALVIVLLSVGWSVSAQYGTKNGDWTAYGGDLGHTRYAPLDQINADNFNKLEVAWRFKTDNLGPIPEFTYESTPVVARGVLYSTGGSRRAVFALDATTGEQLWVFSLNEGPRGEAAPRRLSGRGLSYWTDGREERIIYVTPGYQLVALDSRTGRPVPGFGKNGIVDLKQDNDQIIGPLNGEIGLHATPTVANNVIIVGAAHPSNARFKRNVKGYIRGFDVRTGKRLWIFHTIPRPGEFGNDTWENDSWVYTGHTGSWSQNSADEQLGLVYVGIETPTGDYYGGHRPGNNLFAESLMALDVKTGQRKWHYQYVHHPIWDMDNACPPVLVDVMIDGKLVKAVAHPNKNGFLYVLDRVTGQPVWPIEERPVPQSDVPGEKTSPTQPHPTKPPAYGPQGVSNDDLIDFTPELRAEAIQIASRYRMGPLFTPPVASKREGPIGTLGWGSTASWPGGSFDPEAGTFYIFSTRSLGALSIVPRPSNVSGDMDYVQGSALTGARTTAGAGSAQGGGAQKPIAGAAEAPPSPPTPEGGGGLNVRGLPLAKPPYGVITAIDLKKGETLWKVPHGDTPDNVRNHPALKGLNIPQTGRASSVGTLVTKTLVIAGEGSFVTTPQGRGATLRAYDKVTGKNVGAVFMRVPESGSPMTYMVNGKQYIVIATSGTVNTGELIALRLP